MYDCYILYYTLMDIIGNLFKLVGIFGINETQNMYLIKYLFINTFSCVNMNTFPNIYNIFLFLM